MTESELKQMVQRDINPSCGAVYFSSSLDSPLEMVPANGSFGLVNTGKKKLIVTCHHVWKGFQEELFKNPKLKMFFCLNRKMGTSAALNKYEPVDLDEQKDIAVFNAERLLAECEGRKFFPLQNPVPPVVKGDKILFLGYPGRFRATSSELVRLGGSVYALNVSSVDGWRFFADITEAYKRDDAPARELTAKESPHGGVSGAPCFLFREGQFQLVGFAQGHLVLLGRDYLQFTHASCLTGEGHIIR